MRRANLEIKDKDGIAAVLEAADVCRIGLYADGEVYIVPLNYGYELDEAGALTLYFHCANEGRKLDMIAKNPQACFEMDTGHELVIGEGGACDSSMKYASIIGTGIIEAINDTEAKIYGLTRLMKHYSDMAGFVFGEKDVKRTTVLKLTAHTYTGKRNTE